MIHTDIDKLDSAIKNKAKAAVDEMNADVTLKNMGVSGVRVIETLRELAVQMAYFSRGNMTVDHVRAMYRAAGLYSISDADAKMPITWTLDSKHLRGRAIDIAPVKGGVVWWGAPKEVWVRMGEIGESNGLAWGGRWKNSDTPHFEVL